jgi:predicted PurR-regulated permease PerM
MPAPFAVGLAAEIVRHPAAALNVARTTQGTRARMMAPGGGAWHSRAMTATRTGAPAEDAGAPAERPRQVEIVVSVPTVVKALGIFFGVLLVFLVRDALLSILLSMVFVLGLDPPVSALERHGWGRGKAALAVLGALVAAVFVIVVWAVNPLWDAVHELADNLPGWVQEAKNSGILADVDKGTEAFSKLQDALVDAAKGLPASAVHLLGALAGALGQVFILVTLLFLTLFGLIAKPQLVRAGSELMRPHHAARFERVLDECARAISFSLIGNVVISVIAGSVIFVAAVVVGAPSPIVLAVIVGLFDLIPQVGSAIAAFIVCVITLIAEGWVPALVLLAVILVYQQVENYLIQPAVMRQAVELSGFATIAVVMVGGALLGVIGAVLAVPVAASVKIVMREVTGGRRSRMAELRGQP